MRRGVAALVVAVLLVASAAVAEEGSRRRARSRYGERNEEKARATVCVTRAVSGTQRALAFLNDEGCGRDEQRFRAFQPYMQFIAYWRFLLGMVPLCVAFHDSDEEVHMTIQKKGTCYNNGNKQFVFYAYDAQPQGKGADNYQPICLKSRRDDKDNHFLEFGAHCRSMKWDQKEVFWVLAVPADVPKKKASGGGGGGGGGGGRSSGGWVRQKNGKWVKKKNGAVREQAQEAGSALG